MIQELKEPTSEECSRNAPVEWTDGPRKCRGFAAWYPQMGGYTSHCIIEPGGDDNSCFDVIVWHDGEFPFSGDSGQSPIRLHHCLATQFVEFGRLVQRLAVLPVTTQDIP